MYSILTAIFNRRLLEKDFAAAAQAMEGGNVECYLADCNKVVAFYLPSAKTLAEVVKNLLQVCLKADWGNTRKRDALFIVSNFSFFLFFLFN